MPIIKISGRYFINYFANLQKHHTLISNLGIFKLSILRRFFSTAISLSEQKLNLSNVTNLVFEGGSVRGIAYLGATRRLVEHGFKLEQVKRVAGTSAGGIKTLALGLGYDINQMNTLFKEIDLKNFLDPSDKASKADNFLKIIEAIKHKKYEEIFSKQPLKKSIYKHGRHLFLINTLVTSALLYFNFPQSIDLPVKGWFGYEGITQLTASEVNKHNAAIHRLLLAVAAGFLFNIGFPPIYLWSHYKLLTSEGLEKILQQFIKLIAPDVEQLIVILKSEYGMYQGERLLQWFEQLIYEQTGSPNTTFADIQTMKAKNKMFKDMYFIAVDAESNTDVCFSHETTPKMRLADAARSSMSIPIVFKPHRCSNGEKIGLYIDGGLLNNYPIKQFDNSKYLGDNYPLTQDNRSIIFKNSETLGFKIDTAEEINLFKNKQATNIKIDSLQHLILSIINTYYTHQDNQHSHDKEDYRTIYIEDKGIGTLDFALNDTQKEELIRAGSDAVDKFIAEFGYFNDDSLKTSNFNKIT